jgi:hypothetical protein
MLEVVLAWLVKRTAPLLYLSGTSGSGKSSIMSAWVLPKAALRGVEIDLKEQRRIPASIL